MARYDTTYRAYIYRSLFLFGFLYLLYALLTFMTDARLIWFDVIIAVAALLLGAIIYAKNSST